MSQQRFEDAEWYGSGPYVTPAAVTFRYVCAELYSLGTDKGQDQFVALRWAGGPLQAPIDAYRAGQYDDRVYPGQRRYIDTGVVQTAHIYACAQWGSTFSWRLRTDVEAFAEGVGTNEAASVAGSANVTAPAAVPVSWSGQSVAITGTVPVQRSQPGPSLLAASFNATIAASGTAILLAAPTGGQSLYLRRVVWTVDASVVSGYSLQWVGGQTVYQAVATNLGPFSVEFDDAQGPANTALMWSNTPGGAITLRGTALYSVR